MMPVDENMMLMLQPARWPALVPLRGYAAKFGGPGPRGRTREPRAGSAQALTRARLVHRCSTRGESQCGCEAKSQPDAKSCAVRASLVRACCSQEKTTQVQSGSGFDASGAACSTSR